MMDVAISSLGDFLFHVEPSDHGVVYDSMGVWKSTSGEQGPYLPITGPAWEPARMLLLLLDRATYDVVGKRLDLLVCGRAVSCTFTGTSTAQVVLDLLGAAPGFLNVDPTTLALETANVGLAASIEVVGGDAAPLLGLLVGAKVVGWDPHIKFKPDQTVYPFRDPNSAADVWYQVRHVNSRDATVSDVVLSFAGARRQVVSQDRLTVGFVQLYDLAGLPCENMTVTLYAAQGSVNDGHIMPSSVVRQTNHNGYARFFLVKGTRLTLSISGTNIAREIVVPEADQFDLLDPSISTQPDAYKVQVPSIAVGERRTL